MNTVQHQMGLRRFAAILSVVATGGLTAVLTATSASAASAPTAFCNQVKTSQGAIAKATGAPKDKYGAIAAEWTKIEAVAPAAVKADVKVVRTAYQSAATAGNATALAAAEFKTAAGNVTKSFAQSCAPGRDVSAGGPDGAGDGGGPGGGRGGAAFQAYRDCLTKNGVTLPATGAPGKGPDVQGQGKSTAGSAGAGQPSDNGGQGGGQQGGGQGGGGQRGGGLRGLDQNDPKVAAAMKACASLRPAFGGRGGRGGLGGPDFTAIRACLDKKGIKLPDFGGGQGGTKPTPGAKDVAGSKPAPGAKPAQPDNGGRPQIDDATRAAIQACQAEVAKTAPKPTTVAAKAKN